MYKNILTILLLVCTINNSTNTMQQNTRFSPPNKNLGHPAQKVRNDILIHYPCTVPNCRFRHGKKNVIENHIKIHTMIENGTLLAPAYLCQCCSFLTIHKGVFNRHQASHNEPKFSCDECQRGFKHKDSLWRHMDKKHKINPKVTHIPFLN